MLILETDEQEQIRNMGLMASTFVANPFWIQFQKFLYECVDAKLKALEDSKCASDEIKARAVDRWLVTKELAARIERFPLAAIEAARELGDRNE